MPICGAALHDLRADVLGVERAGVVVDVHAVRLDADGRHVRAELAEDERRDPVGGAVRRVDDDAHAVEREIARERLLREDDVAPARVLEPLGARRCPGPVGARAEEHVVRR